MKILQLIRLLSEIENPDFEVYYTHPDTGYLYGQVKDVELMLSDDGEHYVLAIVTG